MFAFSDSVSPRDHDAAAKRPRFSPSAEGRIRSRGAFLVLRTVVRRSLKRTHPAARGVQGAAVSEWVVLQPDSSPGPAEA